MKKENYRVRKVKVEVKGIIVEYDEFYVVDENGNEIFDRNVEIENDRRLYDNYKKQSNLLTKEEIKSIRKKYDLTQKDYALILGFGEVTINRIERGSIQTDSVDAIMKLSKNPNNMLFLLEQNKNNISKELYNKTINRIKKLKKIKEHALANISNLITDEKIDTYSVFDVAENTIEIYNKKVDELIKEYDISPEYITNLKLQKLLYFVQALSLLLLSKPAFYEDIYAWDYGPVVKEVYKKYKNNKSNGIILKNTPKRISNCLLNIIEEVINSYGTLEATKLISFTHEEDPWKYTKKDDVISTDTIREYYEKVYQ